MKSCSFACLAILLLSEFVLPLQQDDVQPSPSVHTYRSIQAAIDANPGRMVYVPSGDYLIAQAIRIARNGSGLSGPGRIVQTNPEQPIIAIERAEDVQIRDLTLTRAVGTQDTSQEGILAVGCANLTVDNVQVLDNRSRSSALVLSECHSSQIRNSRVVNYMTISVDDRTGSPHWGYACNCIDGTGIVLNGCTAIQVQGNRIIEKHLLPTPEVQRKHGLGKMTKRNAVRGSLVSEETWKRGEVANWHQGSALIATSPKQSAMIQIIGNYVENAAQGIDIHADQVIIQGNVINNAFVGMKAMHGSRNVIIANNQFMRNDLWSIGLMPGTSSHPSRPAHEKQPPQDANNDGGTVVIGNIISDFGYGNARWIWADANCCPIRLDNGQEADDPPLEDVVVSGNIVYDTGRTKGENTAPRYRYAVFISTERSAPKGYHFHNNIFHPGEKGISNVPLPP